eukprot:TRINITY_DN30236_c0_g1_i2.p1 TRINITY_DN30236_c0_g1~~TRINITY_DN30236_c0_g1_i2.p1  ORF type:complete len:684 (+),score=150.95 TRINITY_DN30236_c0_g1_i2:87-2138(+)
MPRERRGPGRGLLLAAAAAVAAGAAWVVLLKQHLVSAQQLQPARNDPAQAGRPERAQGTGVRQHTPRPPAQLSQPRSRAPVPSLAPLRGPETAAAGPWSGADAQPPSGGAPTPAAADGGGDSSESAGSASTASGSGSGAPDGGANASLSSHSGGGGDWPSAEAVLRHAARSPPPGCTSCGAGVVAVAVADGNYSDMLHAWLLHIDPVLPGGVGAARAGVAICAVDAELRRWCAAAAAPCWFEQRCEWLRDRLIVAASLKRLSRARAASVGPQSCKVFALYRALSLGYTALVLDLDVLAMRDPVAAAAALIAAQGASAPLSYQCGERAGDDDRLSHMAYGVWPNSGLLLAAPDTPGADMVAALRDEALWHGRVAGDAALKQPWPPRPRLACRPATIAAQLAGRAKVLHEGMLGWQRHDLQYLCRLLMGLPECSHDQEQYIIRSTRRHGGAQGTGRLRELLRHLRVAYGDAVAREAHNMTAARLRGLTALFCQGNVSVNYRVVPRRWCGDAHKALIRIGISRDPSKMTDAAAKAWVQGLCADVAWGEQEVLREMAALSNPAHHACLPEDDWAMVFKPLCALSPQMKAKCQNPKAAARLGPLCRCEVREMRKPALNLVTLHLTGGDGKPKGGVRFAGGLSRFETAQRHGLALTPPCRRSFRAPTAWWSGPGAGAGAAPPAICKQLQ